MDGCMFKVVLKNGMTVGGWLYVQRCLKALEDNGWLIVCSELF